MEEFHWSSLPQPIDSWAILRLPPYISVISARLPISAVNMEVQDAERQHDGEAPDRAGAEHEQHHAGDAAW